MERLFAELLRDRGKLGAFIELGRPWNGLILGFMTVIGAAFTSTTAIPLSSILLLFTPLFFAYIAGATVNNLIDQKVDEINMPYMPLQEGRISVNEARIFTVTFYILSIIISAIIGFKFLMVTLFFIFLSLAYSIPPLAFEKRGILGNISLGIVTILVPAYAGAVFISNSFTQGMLFWETFLAYTLLFSIVIILKDFKDIKGDTIHGKKTFVVRVGKKNAWLIVFIGTIITAPLVTYIFYSLFNNVLFSALAGIVILTLLWLEIKFLNYDELQAERGFRHLRVIMMSHVFVVFIFIFAMV